MATDEAGDDVGEHADPDVERRGDANRAAGSLAELGDRGARLIEPGDRVARAIVIGAPSVGEAELAGGALEEPHAEIVLEAGDASAHRRFREAERLGRRGEALGLDDADEDGDVVEIDAG